MKCIVCKQADTAPGYKSVLLERGETTFVVKNVPARICPICSEAYMDEKITIRLLRHAGQLVSQNLRVDVREYEILSAGE